MSAKVDAERAEMAWEANVERSKEVQRRIHSVGVMTADGISVAEQARRLVLDQVTIRFYQRVLGWRVTRPPKSRRGTLYGEVRL